LPPLFSSGDIILGVLIYFYFYILAGKLMT